MSRKSRKRYDLTFAFAASLQGFAEARLEPITVDSFKVEKTRTSGGSYDTLVVTFRVPRPDEDNPEIDSSEDPLEKILQDVEASMNEMEVNNHEV